MNWLSQNMAQVVDLTLMHFAITVPAVLLSIVLAVPGGWLANRYRRPGATALTAIGVLYAVPSLPLLVLVPVVIGTGLRSPVNLVIVLTIYGVAILTRGACNAFEAVSAETKFSATAIGYSEWRRFWSVDLPLAAPVILANVRVVTVSTISLVTIGSVVGIRSLGTLLTDGFQRGIVAEVTTGLVLTVALALTLDALWAAAGRRGMPWTRDPAPATAGGRFK
jgi:osmoprotectant transport system permease protein